MEPISPASPTKPAALRGRWVETRRGGLCVVELAAVGIAGTLIVLASVLRWWPVPVVEAWGFASGIACVWLVLREHLWNWPIGLANNVFFFALFLQSRLYADMGLQVVYFGLGIYGWLNWVRGGVNRAELTITRTTRAEWLVLAASVPVGTWLLREILVRVNGAAPFADALTTVLCLAAQYLLCRKRLENWWFWIVADMIYVPLYLSRDLPLTAVLYGVFLVLCGFGWAAWRRTWRTGAGEEAA